MKMQDLKNSMKITDIKITKISSDDFTALITIKDLINNESHYIEYRDNKVIPYLPNYFYYERGLLLVIDELEETNDLKYFGDHKKLLKALGLTKLLKKLTEKQFVSFFNKLNLI